MGTARKEESKGTNEDKGSTTSRGMKMERSEEGRENIKHQFHFFVCIEVN